MDNKNMPGPCPKEHMGFKVQAAKPIRMDHEQGQGLLPGYVWLGLRESSMSPVCWVTSYDEKTGTIGFSWGVYGVTAKRAYEDRVKSYC